MLSKDQDQRFRVIVKNTAKGLEIVLKGADGTPVHTLGGDHLNRVFRIVSEWFQTLVVDAKTGADLNLHLKLRKVPKRGYELTVSEELWIRLALLAELVKGMRDMNRVELIALRIHADNDIQVNYFYRCVAVSDWGVKGLRMIFSGDGSDPEKVARKLSEYRTRFGF